MNNQADKIRCPNCNTWIPITKTLQDQFTESARREYEQKLAEQKRSFLEQQKEMAEKEKELEEKEKRIDETVEQNLKVELEKQKKILFDKAKKEAQNEIIFEMNDLRESLTEKDKKLEAAKQLELQLRKRERQLEERAKDVELEVARKIDHERENIRNEVTQKFLDEHRMKNAEKDKQINDMRRQIEDLKRRAEQGSQQAQGEVQELELENEIAQLFPVDNIEPVPKGIKGADIIQEVLTNSGSCCGKIIWESKRTKNWNDGWIPKLKVDQRSIKADIAVIVTQVLPKEINNFNLIDGVWVTNYASLQGLALVLRQKLIELAVTKAITLSKDKKADILFHYLTGPEFRQRVEAIIEAFNDMKIELDKERRVYERSWAKREKQLQSVLLNTSGMYGDLQGMIGPSMHTIPALEAEITDEEDLKEESDGIPEKEVNKNIEEDSEEDIPF
ncbi:MAG: DUF2130 domain-containing protein [Candidatus Caldatribacteriota bacterium]